MSGYIPDIASWALGGGAGNNNNDGGNEGESSNNEPPSEQLSEQEIRARRLARMSGGGGGGSVAEKNSTEKKDAPVPMEVDQKEEDRKPAAATTTPMEISSPKETTTKETTTTPMEISKEKKNITTTTSPSTPTVEPVTKKKKASTLSSLTPGNKLQKKKELLLKKVMQIVLTNGNINGDTTSVTVDLGDSSDITTQTIAEIFASRLAMKKSALPPSLQKGIISYLGSCHKRASEDIKAHKQLKESKQIPELESISEEIKSQAVSYAASMLMVPDLFESDGAIQLAKCLLSSSTDLANSITFGVSGKDSSFYQCVCTELLSQDPDCFDSIIGQVVDYFTNALSKVNTVLDSGTDGAEGGGLVVVSAFCALCSNKKAALAITKKTNFLLPAAGTPEAQQRTELPPPPLPAGASQQQRQLFRFMQAMQGRGQILKRSGPALERDTILGLILRLGCPKDDPSVTSAFPNVMANLDTVEKTADHQRRQLLVYQETCNNLIRSLVTAGPDARKRVMAWITDALLVNVGASAMRPDHSKVSKSTTLINLSVVLLKLCEPFMNTESKIGLVDPGFASSEKDHGGVFAISGDDAVSRLGENTAAASDTPYNPKNSFIPQCFFFAARSLHLGIVPFSAFYIQLLRNINQVHHEIRQQNGDLQTHPDFNRLVSMQRAVEVTVFLEDMIAATLRFCNLMARFLLRLDAAQLGLMPEHFVDDICEILLFLAKVTRIKPKLMQGHNYGNIFKIVVRLLSPEFANLVRNYNLRAKLGDVLHDVFLPSEMNENRHLPSSVPLDPSSGGQTYMLSDTTAQETLAPSLLLLYGEVEHTGVFRMSHRANIASLLKYLWEHEEHRPAFRRITANKDSFIKFANGIMNETNDLIASVMKKLPEIRTAQRQRADASSWAALSDEEREQITSRLEENEQNVRGALPLCNKTLQMLGYLNTDNDIRKLFMLQEMCTRLVDMLFYVLTKLVGSKGLELKVDNPEDYDFRPKEMLRDLCAIFALFARSSDFQIVCAKSGYYNSELVSKSVKTCTKLNLLTGESMEAFSALPKLVEEAARSVASDDALLADAPDEFLDPIVLTFMKDPVLLPTSGNIVDRSTIAQHLLNDPHDPFNRKDLTIEDVQPATELKQRMEEWVNEKRASK